MIIGSNQNKSYKWLKSLTTKKYREREGVLLLEGKRMIKHALELGIKPKLVLVSESKMTEDEFHADLIMKDVLFDTLCDTVHSQGYLAVIEISDLESLDKRKGKHVVVCDSIQDPGNLGTILRTCDALGVYDIYLTKGCVDPFSPKVLRSTMGALFTVNIFRNWETEELVSHLKNAGYQLVSTALSNSVPLKELDCQTSTAMVFGNEGNGVSQALLSASDVSVRIPMTGNAESLNVGVAAGIVLYHLNSYCT